MEKKERIGFLRVGGAVVAAGFCAAAVSARADEAVQVMVRYRADTAPAVIEQLEKELSLPRVRVLPASRLYLYRADSVEAGADLVRRLTEDSAVESAEVDETIRISPQS